MTKAIETEQNFSNYSAWQQRSALLPIVYNTPDALNKALEEGLSFNPLGDGCSADLCS